MRDARTRLPVSHDIPTFRAGHRAATRPVSRNAAGVVVALLLFLAAPSHLLGQTLSESTSSPEERAAAIRSIPFNELTDETRAKLANVLNHPDLYRRLPIVAIESDPDLYLHLVRHPEVVINIWQLMGISEIQARRVGDYVMDASDGSGTTSRIELVYGTPNLHVMYAEGLYEGPLLRNPITGRCVLVLRSDYGPGEDGQTVVRNRLDVFMTVDQRGIGMLARSLQSLVGKAADHNFVETTNFLERLSQSAEENGPGVQQMASQMEQVDPQVKREFSELAMLAHRRAQHRLTAGLRVDTARPATPSTTESPRETPLAAAPSTSASGSDPSVVAASTTTARPVSLERQVAPAPSGAGSME